LVHASDGKEDVMFETAMLSSGPATRRVWSACAGFAGQVLLVGVALAPPMILPRVIPRASWIETISPPGLPRGGPQGVAKVAPHRVAKAAPRPMRCTFCEPVEVPKTIKPLDEPPDLAPIGGIDGKPWIVGVPWNEETDNLATRVVAQIRPVPRPSEPVRHAAPAVAPTPTAPLRLSRVELATPLHRVEPVYPPLAITAHVQGVVQLMGVLGTDGRIRELKVLNGHPMLVKAAVDAVQQWIYAPTLLNGEPVEVQAPIEVRFILSR
jgi:protein TonB